MTTGQLWGLVYVSSATGPLNERDLECLVAEIVLVNASFGVTGVLLYHDGSFFQYLEGHRQGLDSAYERIKRSPLHRGLIELFQEPVERRYFETWHMGVTGRLSSPSLKGRNDRWLQECERLKPKDRHSKKASIDGVVQPPLSLVMGFWTESSRAIV